MNWGSSYWLQDAWAAATWIVVNALAAFAAWRVADRLYAGDYAGRVLHAAVLWCAAVVLVLTLLGAVGLLSGTSMLLGMAAASLGALKFAGPANEPGEVDGTGRTWTGRPPVILWSLLFGLLCGHAVMHGVLRFPTDFDSLMYHMPLIDRWLQSGSLYVPDNMNWFFSANSELLGAWMVGPFSGDFLIALNNVPVVVVWAASGVSLGRQLGLTGWWPHLAALSMLSVHITLLETDDASNDLMVVAFFAAAATYTARYLTSRRATDLVLCGVCIGLLAGVKYFALGYAAVCLGTLAATVLLTGGWKESLRASAIVALVSLPFGGYWYIRNVLVTGLPLFPMGFTEATPSLGYPDIWSTSFWGNGSPDLLELGMRAVWRMCGPIQFAAVAMTPMIVLTLAGLSIKDRLNEPSGQNAVQRLALALWIAGAAAVLLVTPCAVEDQPGTLNHLLWMYTPVRYGLCFLSFSVLGLFVLLHRLTEKTWGWISWAMLAAGAAVLIWQIVERLRYFADVEGNTAYFEVAFIGFDVAAILFILWEFGPQRWKPIPTGITLLLVTAATSAGILIVADRWHRGFATHFDRYFTTRAFTLMEESDPEGTSIGVCFYRSYPFFGSARQNTIVQPRLFESAEMMERLINERDLQYVVARPDKSSDEVDRCRGALDYFRQSPQRFEPVGNGRSPQVFRVK